MSALGRPRPVPGDPVRQIPDAIRRIPPYARCACTYDRAPPPPGRHSVAPGRPAQVPGVRIRRRTVAFERAPLFSTSLPCRRHPIRASTQDAAPRVRSPEGGVRASVDRARMGLAGSSSWTLNTQRLHWRPNINSIGSERARECLHGCAISPLRGSQRTFGLRTVGGEGRISWLR